MLKELINGKFYYYRIEDGGIGIVKAETKEEAEKKIREAYNTHSSLSEYTDIEIGLIRDGAWFEDAPDVIEICE